ncbi:Ribosomal oxygenase 2 [Coccomyxa sp. Obi]|nr:Ribosomal oxygenase 2 [Coccomyxa sp. Obi]
MGKRKREKTSVETAQKRASSCTTALHSLLGSTLDMERFMAAHWERKPVVFKSPDDARRKHLASLFNLSSLWDCVKEAQKSDQPIQQGRDINVVRYKDGIRETLEDQEEGGCERWQQLYKEGWTLQVHQPQRFCDALTEQCFSLERQLGCLVGSNAYITPAGAQGLAPHHDDVEIFVVQTEGRKKWRLYAPLGGLELPSTSSNDLSEDVIGEPTMEITLEVGDVLYMPRGTVHEAITDDTSASCHITISAYQHFSFATLAQHVLGTLTEGQTAEVCLPIELRRGLPIGFLYQHGLQHDTAGVLQRGARKQSSGSKVEATSAAASLAQGLRKLADAVERDPALLSMAADSMAVDFMASRLPPKEGNLPDVGEAPTQSSSVRCRGSGLFRMMPLGDQDTPEDTEGGWVKVMSCLHNDVHSHMMGGSAGGCEQEGLACCRKRGEHSHASDDGDGDASEEIESESEEEEEEEEENEECGGGAADMVFPASYSFAIAQLLATADSKGIKVSDIKLPSKEDKLGLAFALWSEGVICTVPPE